MGFLKNIFGAVFGLISGLLKLVGIGKKSEYFLEIDDAKAKAAEALTPQKKPESTEAKKPEPANVPTPAPAPTARIESASAASQNGARASAKAVEGSLPVAAATVSTNGSSTFAPDYLITANSASSRRRPGANMSTFMTMARQVKTSRS